MFSLDILTLVKLCHSLYNQMCFIVKKVVINIWIDIWASERLEKCNFLFFSLSLCVKICLYIVFLIGHFFLPTEAIVSMRGSRKFYQKWSNFDVFLFFIFG